MSRVDQQLRIRRALRNYNRRARIAMFLDHWMAGTAKYLPLCGEGKKNNWSILFAQMFMADCQCCYFYRGVTVGIAFTLFVIAVILSALFAPSLI